jgi:hypothetical protein
MDIEKKKELWDRLENEPERAYRAFESYRNLPSAERRLIEAYRQHVGNRDAVKPSDTWSRWSSEFAWRERAAAYDDHMANKRREAYERGVEEEAERQGALAERTRGRMFELLTLSYDAAMSCFEDSDWAKDNLRSGDVLKIIALHLDVAEKFGALKAEEGIAEGDWDESKLEKDAKGDAEVDRILAEIEALREKRRAEGHVDEPEEDLL